ncbi:MAG TPA: hypothetical protein VJL36_01805 [Candidatus Paceibacterota bacterium]
MSVISLLKSYIGWHYSLALAAWWRIYTNCLWFLFNFFSVSILIRTLFSPWRRLTEGYPAGFAPSAAAEILIINLLMRAVGLVIRTVFILFAGLTLTIAFFLGWLALVFWLVAPVVILGSFFTGFYLIFLT